MSDIGDNHDDYFFGAGEFTVEQDQWESDSFIEAQYWTEIEESLRCLEELDPLQVRVDPTTLLLSDSVSDLFKSQ